MLNDQQYAQLLRPLNQSRVSQRSQAGRSLSYLEAWDVKAHLIRIFGFGNWSWEVLSADLAFEEKNEKGQWNVGYKVIGQLRVPSNGNNLGVAYYTEAAVGSATLPQRGEAHDMAVKTAESDALKRAAINLGTQFGLSLYKNGTLQDVVGTTLDRGAPEPLDSPVVEPERVSEPVSDAPGAETWVQAMKVHVEAKDVASLLALKKEMSEEGVEEDVYQGITLAKWFDRALVSAGKN